MRAFTVAVEVRGRTFVINAAQVGGTDDCPVIYLSDKAFAAWALPGRACEMPLEDLEETMDELYDLAFDEWCRQEEEDMYETE